VAFDQPESVAGPPRSETLGSPQSGTGRCLAIAITSHLPAKNRSKYVWAGTESNCRHKDFQSFALPTELPARMLGEAIFRQS
jgi:hypothetical protein